AAEAGRRIDLLRRIAGDDQRSSARDAAAEQRELERRQLLGLVDQQAVIAARRSGRDPGALGAQPLQLEQYRVILGVDRLRVFGRRALVDRSAVHRLQPILVDMRVLALGALAELDARVL